eukprot:scaffold533840_cov35-Prasinocladus_malaysianus.AAC.1
MVLHTCERPIVPLLTAESYLGLLIRRMAERTEEAMKIPTFQERWNQWMMVAQARSVPPFTPRQYDVVKVPDSIHKKLRDNFHRLLPTAGSEGTEGRGVFGLAKFFPQ